MVTDLPARWQVLTDAGIKVSNPALSFVAHHLQLSAERAYRQEDDVPGKGMFLKISDEFV